MGNSIEDKDWSGSNESLLRFMENAKTITKIKELSMKGLLEKSKVQWHSTENEEKSSIVERWNRTIK